VNIGKLVQKEICYILFWWGP